MVMSGSGSDSLDPEISEKKQSPSRPGSVYLTTKAGLKHLQGGMAEYEEKIQRRLARKAQ